MQSGRAEAKRSVLLLEIGLALIEHLAGEPADRRVFGLRQIGERNPRRGIDDLKAVARQQDDAGFLGQAEQEVDAEVARDEP